ncbi:MAG: glycoside hydrolase family 99-like domain-containing protein, partial [Pseudomonadota bacterium]
DHSTDNSLRFLERVNRYFRDDRYIKIDGKPLLVVYRPELIPNMVRTQALWRKRAATLGWPGIYLVSAQSFGQEDPREFQFNAAVEFPPHNATSLSSMKREVPNLHHAFRGRISDYAQLAGFFRTRLQPQYKLFRSVMLGWDNTARRGKQATVFWNFSLTGYAQWLFSACRSCLADPWLAEHEKLVFINAWNEWGEGTYLEPDNKYGFGYLEATKRVVNACAVKKPRLSVIVPNYNHARFLERRLRSIIHQSHKPDEIIFLDDVSSDDSIAIARNILGKSSIKFTILKNEINSGNVFKQWLKGIEHATGDLIWIAESDDSAVLDFLANILPRFDREDVLLAYGEISYINPDDTPHPDLGHYYDEVEGLNGLSWKHSHVVSAYRAFTGACAVKNIIPNVSGAVFRKPHLSGEEIERLTSYTFAGDWYFYALVARGGAIAFCKEARSYFRLNRSSTSRQAFFSAKHVREHQMILQDLHGMYGIGEAAIRDHVRALWGVLKHRLPDLSREDLSESLKVQADGEQRGLRICIASYGFVVGGGEVVPIDLANALRARGHQITFLVLVKNFEDDSPLLRYRLRSDIPVVFWDDVKQAFQDFLDEFGIEIFNSHNFGVEYNLDRAGIDINIPYIASLHGGYEEVEEELLREGLMNYVKKNVDEWLYLADKNIVPLMTRGLDDARFTKSFNAPALRPANVGWELDIRKQLNLGDDTVLLVLASRAVRDKGWQRAIEVTQRVREATARDCRLVLIGDGPDFQAIRAANVDKDFVRFLGRLDNSCPVIKGCDIGIFPSTFSGESFPLFVLECLQTGLPVVATDIGEIPNIVMIEGEMAGCVVSRNQSDEALIDEMVQALIELVTDENNMILAKQRAGKAAARFSMDKLVEFYLDVMFKYIKRGSPLGCTDDNILKVNSHFHTRDPQYVEHNTD